MNKNEVLDLHYYEGDWEFDVPEEGELFEDIDEISRRINEVKDTVKKINLKSQDNLTEFPAIISECLLLEELDVCYSGINSIPVFIFTLPNLRVLKTTACPVAGFSQGLSHKAAINLEELSIWIPKGTAFPEEICELPKLKKLNVCILSNIPLPLNLGNIKSLEELSMDFYCKEPYSLSFFPDSFSGHQALKKLVIEFVKKSNNKALDINQFVKILASCPSFESLSLKGLLIENGYGALSQLVNLKELKLSNIEPKDPATAGNPFEAIAVMRNLEKLELYGEALNIKELPDVFSNLTKLEKFCLGSNFIQNLPPSFYELTNLTELEIENSGIAALDERIGNLKTLEHISLLGNMLVTLPEAIFNLPKLNHLNIQSNNFNRKELSSIRKKIKTLAKAGQKIKFYADFQGNLRETKRLMTINRNPDTNNKAELASAVYIKQCIAAVKENPAAIKYVNLNLRENDYRDICLEAVKKAGYAITYVNPEKLGKWYFYICKEAVKYEKLDSGFTKINYELLTYIEYLQLCLNFVQNNKYSGTLEHIDHQRFNREDYELICRTAIIYNILVIKDVVDPTPELCLWAINKGARLKDIPEHLRTYEICLHAVKTGRAGDSGKYNQDADMNLVPPQFMDAQMIAANEEYKQSNKNDIPF